MSERPYVWQMVREAIDRLGGRATNMEIRDCILQQYPDVNASTIQCQVAVCTVNSPSRVHYPENFHPRIANTKYDFLFKVERGVVERYDPERHGLWEIRRDNTGNRQVGLIRASRDETPSAPHDGPGPQEISAPANAPMPWEELLPRYGFPVEPTPDGDLRVLVSGRPLDLLYAILQQRGHASALDRATLRLAPGADDEEQFVQAYRSQCRRGDQNIEPCVAGLVQVFRELGIETEQSCEGHPATEGSTGARPYIQFSSEVGGLQAFLLLRVIDRALESGPLLNLNGDWLTFGNQPTTREPENLARSQKFLLDAASLIRTNLDQAREGIGKVHEGYYLFWEPVDDSLDA